MSEIDQRFKLCPACGSKRPLAEFYCQAQTSGKECNWELIGEPEQQSSATDAASKGSSAPPLVCPNGHSIEPGDQMCTICGLDVSSLAIPTAAATPTPLPSASQDEHAAQHDLDTDAPTAIDGWRLESELPTEGKPWTRYFVKDPGDRHGVLTLYDQGSEPDQSVHAVLRRMDRDHIPELYATGRWQERAYEVTERIFGESLRAAGYLAAQSTVLLERVVGELARALASFQEMGLRHRDLNPDTILLRSSDPLDLVITGFGSARLSDFDLDAVAPLQLTRYSSAEAIVGGVSAASDWWSLGVILLEQLTRGACFTGVNDRAFHIHVVTRGISVPQDIAPRTRELLRGLLARDPLKRWKWDEVQRWLEGELSNAPSEELPSDEDSPVGPAIKLGDRTFHRIESYALAAAEAERWEASKAIFLRGALATWLEQLRVDNSLVASVRRLQSEEGLAEDIRHGLALMVLNASLPLTVSGEIVTPAWLLSHPQDGYEIITGPVARHLERMERELWIVRLQSRAQKVRERAQLMEITLDEEQLRLLLLASSRSNLEAERSARRRIYPHSEHVGIAALLDHERLTDEELIILISASLDQFVPLDEVLRASTDLARQTGVRSFDTRTATALMIQSRREIYSQVEERTAGFASSSYPRINEWAEAFRVERRISLARAAVLLAVMPDAWLQPPKQTYISELLGHFEKRVVRAVQQGPLVRFTIGKTTPRVDLFDLGTAAQPAEAILDHLIRRSAVPLRLDPSALLEHTELLNRLRKLVSHSLTFRRDTGIDGRYLGFPFVILRDQRLISSDSKPRILPVLLWPVTLELAPGAVSTPVLTFDGEREEVRLNPALDGLLGPDEIQKWLGARDELLMRSSLRAIDAMNIFGTLAAPNNWQIAAIPGKDIRIPTGRRALYCAAALFNAEFTGQAIAEDLRRLRGRSIGNTSLANAFRLPAQLSASDDAFNNLNGSGRSESSMSGSSGKSTSETAALHDVDPYLTVASDPSQEAAILLARTAPGLLVEGPPGTGKSQTIVNIIADSIGRLQPVLVICQKLAALQVVQKRLEAEGLGDRLFVVTDANKDRTRFIHALRAQLDKLRATPDQNMRSERQQRETLLGRLRALEAELNAHQTSMRSVDETAGLSYRGVLNELIALSQYVTPIAFPALRSWLGDLPHQHFADLEENIAPLAPLWLRAEYEGNPLSVLLQFSADEYITSTLRARLDLLVDAELSRDQLQLKQPTSFEVGDPIPYIAWLERREGIFLAATEDTFANSGRWANLFEKGRESSSVGPRLIAGLQDARRIATQLQNLDCEVSLLGKCAELSDDELAHWLRVATRATKDTSLWGRLSVSRWAARRRYMAWLTEHGIESTEPRMRTTRAMLSLESKLRPVRRSVFSIRQQLSLTQKPPVTTPNQILVETAQLSDSLSLVSELALAASEFPRSEIVFDALQHGSRAGYSVFRNGLNAALLRHDSRVKSLAALDALVPWFQPEWIEARRANIAAAHPSLGGLKEIVGALTTVEAFQQFRARASRLGPDAVRIFGELHAQREALVTPNSDQPELVVRRGLRREALLGWKDRLEREYPGLLLQREEIEQKVRRLAELDGALREINRALLANDIDRVSLGAVKDWTAITKLTGPNALRLREILDRGGDLGLFRLRPVWLMNPDTASRLLPLREAFFDIVIFDEASQMLVEHATPTLFRAGRVVVSGDDKQMPPTSFFRGRADIDEEQDYDGSEIEEEVSDAEREIAEETWNRREIKDCPDLLALGGGCLPRATLQIHYRSKYRELIDFSNAAFYQSRLSVPARHPDAEIRRVKPIELIRADGTYESQTNSEEADRVVSVLADLWALPTLSPSIGVVTFNRKQADLISERIEIRAAQDTEFLSAYARELDRTQDGEDMGFFVKNVENVQGDERDVIIFSTTFGRDRAGAFKRFFGVLGQTGGERRLNVAVTRAREKVILVTSMPISDISDMLAVNRRPDRPRDYLQAYLDYATKISAGELALACSATERLSPRRAEQQAVVTRDAFIDAVTKFVSDIGYDSVRANDGDTFGVDLAVVDARTGQFGLAIECDAPWDRQGHLRTARARELWRPSVIRHAIPAIHRVWAQQWYRAPLEEQRRLADVLVASLGPATQSVS